MDTLINARAKDMARSSVVWQTMLWFTFIDYTKLKGVAEHACVCVSACEEGVTGQIYWLTSQLEYTNEETRTEKRRGKRREGEVKEEKKRRKKRKRGRGQRKKRRKREREREREIEKLQCMYTQLSRLKSWLHLYMPSSDSQKRTLSSCSITFNVVLKGGQQQLVGITIKIKQYLAN